MQLGHHTDALLGDLATLGGLGDESVACLAERLTQALRASVGLRLLDVLGEAALEISEQLPSGRVEVRLAGQDPSLLYVEEGIEPSSEPVAAGLDARITLRLPESLKTGIEAAAAREGLSVNTWVVRALKRGVDVPARRSGRRLTGYAES